MNLGQWLGLSSLIISSYILWEIRQVLLLVFTAVIFATALNRLVKWLEKFKIRRNLSILIIVITIIFLSIIFGWLVIPPFLDQFEKLLGLLPNVWERLRNNLILLSATQSRFDWLPPPPSLTDLITQLQP
ncbi:MAG: AI-2E family transporter, partial [Crocosphaera sp.]